MPETIHATGSGSTFMSELAAMVKGRRNHPSIIQWDIFNECSPTKETVEKSVRTPLKNSVHLVTHLTVIW